MKITFLSFTNGHNIIFYIKRGQNLENNVKKLKIIKFCHLFLLRNVRKKSAVFL